MTGPGGRFTLPTQVDEFTPHPLRGTHLSDPSQVAVYFDDYTDDDIITDKYVVTATGTSIIRAATVSNGYLELIPLSGTGQSITAQTSIDGGTGAAAIWRLRSAINTTLEPLHTVYMVRFRTNATPNALDIYTGLINGSVGNAFTPGNITDGVYFRLNESDGSLDLVSVVSSVETSVQVVDSTFDSFNTRDIAFSWNGATTLTAWVKDNDVWTAKAEITDTDAIPLDDSLAITHACSRPSTSGQNHIDIDYTYVYSDRTQGQ